MGLIYSTDRGKYQAAYDMQPVKFWKRYYIEMEGQRKYVSKSDYKSHPESVQIELVKISIIGR